MSVFKEEVDELENLARRQRQIYSDACDYGILATPEIKDSMRRLLKTLPDVRVTWKSNKPIVQRTYESVICWSGEDGTKVRIHYANDKPRKKEYFSIDLERANFATI